ncbi:hypothetical protein CT0861_06556 [Colletotrichum tofieldiae]|uniref:Uncharacterized protein n=1 Tax=Colletotrichum tofieldiae TaxID=708197 RepID=A0A166TZT5_9PEZI|nr:hypothetical protein CT0861_06556 [Colletotrichum tofieldiae]
MCNILKHVSECQRCFKTLRFENLDQPCIQVVNTPNSEIGACGTLTSQEVLRPRDRVCNDCRRPAQQKAEDRKDTNRGGESYSQCDYLDPYMPAVDMAAHNTVAQPEGSENQEGDQTERPIVSSTANRLVYGHAYTEAIRRVRQKPGKYNCPSETSSENSEDFPSPNATPVALSRSKAQPPLLLAFLASGSPRIHTQTPQAATALRIESSWDTKSKLPQAEDDPWWYPEIWGPAKDLPAELASLLCHLPPADTFHDHRIYIFRDDFNEPIEKSATVLLVTPKGKQARIVSGALYDEGSRLVTRRHLARMRYEELSREEREKMARGEQCCIFYPCRVACCPLLHQDGQHQPITPGAETLLSAMERGYNWRKNWETRIPRPASSFSGRRYRGSRSPPRRRSPVASDEQQRPIQSDLTIEQDVSPKFGEERKQTSRAGAVVVTHRAIRQPTKSDEEGPFEASSWETDLEDQGEMTERFAYRGRVGRIRPAYYHLVARRDGSPVPSGQRTRREQTASSTTEHSQVDCLTAVDNPSSQHGLQSHNSNHNGNQMLSEDFDNLSISGNERFADDV